MPRNLQIKHFFHLSGGLALCERICVVPGLEVVKTVSWELGCGVSNPPSVCAGSTYWELLEGLSLSSKHAPYPAVRLSDGRPGPCVELGSSVYFLPVCFCGHCLFLTDSARGERIRMSPLTLGFIPHRGIDSCAPESGRDCFWAESGTSLSDFIQLLIPNFPQ